MDDINVLSVAGLIFGIRERVLYFNMQLKDDVVNTF